MLFGISMPSLKRDSKMIFPNLIWRICYGKIVSLSLNGKATQFRNSIIKLIWAGVHFTKWKLLDGYNLLNSKWITHWRKFVSLNAKATKPWNRIIQVTILYQDFSKVILRHNDI